MSNDLKGVVDARLSKVETELANIDAKIKAATASFQQQRADLTKERNFYLDMKREAGLLPPEKPKGNPNFRKKTSE